MIFEDFSEAPRQIDYGADGSVPEDAPEMAFGPAGLEAWRRIRTRTMVLLASLGVATALAMLLVFAIARQRAALAQVIDNPTADATRILVGTDDLVTAATVASFISGFVTLVALSFWLHRALRLRTEQGAWVHPPAFGGWAPMVPVGNVFMPIMAMRDIANGRRARAVSTRHDPLSMAWWLLVILGTVLVRMNDAGSTASETLGALGLAIAGWSVLVVAGFVGMAAVLHLTHQVSLGQRVDVQSGGDPHAAGIVEFDKPVPARVLGSRATVVGALGVLLSAVAVALIAGMSVPEAQASLVVAGASPNGVRDVVLTTELQAPMCIALDAELGAEILALPTVPCTELHSTQVYANVAFSEGAGAPYPSIEQIDLRSTQMCADAFYDEFRQRFDEVAYYPLVLFPLEQSWRMGDRWVVCMAESIDPTDSLLGAGPDLRVSSQRSIVNRFGLAVGECADPSTSVAWFVLVPCDQPHTLEMIHLDGTGPQPALPVHPGDEQISEDALDLCTGEIFEDYVGVEWVDSQFDVVALFTEEVLAEALGHIHVGCVLRAFEPVTGSLRGSGR